MPTHQTTDPATIMIVDDVARNIQLLASVLDTAGYQIAAASDGRQALDMIEAVSPDLVLLDVMMPGINGFEVCKRIKDSASTSHIPVILLTARTASEDVIAGFKAGAVDYVTKPFNTRELLARVNTHIALKKARDTRKKLIAELREALKQVKTLSGLFPICPYCKKVRSDKGYWLQVEEYVTDQCQAFFSHSVCPECVRKYYPEIAEKIGTSGSDEQETA